MSTFVLRSDDSLGDLAPPLDLEDPPPPIDLPPDYDPSTELSDTLPTPGADLPPAYPVNLPSSFPIAAHDTHSLVKLSEVEAHLRLLGAFWQLRQDVTVGSGTETSWDELSETERWVVFVSRAVWRFELWYTKMLLRPGRDDRPLGREETPPLDVAMIWHAFYLNPLEYLEDGLVRARRLLKMSGTLIDYTTGLPDFKKSYFLNRRLLQFFESVCKKPEQKTAEAIGDLVKWNTAQVEYCMRIGMRLIDNSASPSRWGRLLSHYNHAGIFSLDLIGATLRQGSFIKEMVDLGWTRPGAFSTDKTVLVRSIARYHAWLDLCASAPLKAVPTLDIDLVWHTNMLFADRYRSETYNLLGYIPNHDDKVEENALADAFDETARAWRMRFGVPYSLCGCAPPTTDSALKKLKSIGRRGSTNSRLATVDAKSLVGEDDSDNEDEVTHPSEHYSVLVLNNSSVEHARSKRTDDLRKTQEQIRKMAAKGKISSSIPDIGRQERTEPRPGHMQAFRRARPGPEEERRAAYDAYLVDAKSMGAGRESAVVFVKSMDPLFFVLQVDVVLLLAVMEWVSEEECR
ncbi:hypothetical protein DACRYDRAFT_112451 [Dacryopinax primogenitus]|uniref:Uncharacterized protein n=1 Tax=Dacryopinax primogenitus (strain DJM 731) TaxID=1858805 RepID=M5FUC7_DACPD|nr:uncharacterized protein DACRYDRAFT_112451 [Dacryopinax primogenitus]EJT96836.1 hypothetical protein DACRYDRAFT_112451 [Dacryopinax primogenitus]